MAQLLAYHRIVVNDTPTICTNLYLRYIPCLKKTDEVWCHELPGTFLRDTGRPGTGAPGHLFKSA
jgi:hypothetical protein